VNPRRRRHLRTRRSQRSAIEREKSRDACLYGKVHTRDSSPYLGTFDEWQKLPIIPDKLGVIYHPSLIQQIGRRSVWLDLLKHNPFGDGGDESAQGGG
jgi:hypothetical protein